LRLACFGRLNVRAGAGGPMLCQYGPPERQTLEQPYFIQEWRANYRSHPELVPRPELVF
jgi:hypothetical protein